MTDYIAAEIETDNLVDALIEARLAARHDPALAIDSLPMTLADAMKVINEISRDIESRDAP